MKYNFLFQSVFKKGFGKSGSTYSTNPKIAQKSIKTCFDYPDLKCLSCILDLLKIFYYQIILILVSNKKVEFCKKDGK